MKIRYLVQAGINNLQYTLLEEVSDTKDGSVKVKELLTSYNHEWLCSIRDMITEAHNIGIVIGKLEALSENIEEQRREIERDKVALGLQTLGD